MWRSRLPLIALTAVLLGPVAVGCRAQAVADSLHVGRAWLVAGGATAYTAGSLIALDQAWYQGHGRSAFHGFNDGGEWLQVDNEQR